MGLTQVTGRCYCGAVQFTAKTPQAVTFCHCSDCRRVTGAPVAAFAAFRDTAFEITKGELKIVSVNSGVTRAFCAACGSPVTGRYDYLPGSVYVSLGLIDQTDALAAERHAHYGNKLAWLHLSDDLPRHDASARADLP